MKTTAFILTMLLSAVVSAQQKPTTGYAPVNGLKMYYEIHGSGDPVVLLHGAFMTITNNWPGWIGELSKSRKVIAVDLQGHGRTADIERDFSYENLADDVAALLDHLKIPRADLIGYSMGGGVAMQCAIHHPQKVRKVVSRPRSATTASSRKHSTLSRNSRRRPSKARPSKANTRN
jgi:pimeloyl-ACP methyl ester carboxylesterase